MKPQYRIYGFSSCPFCKKALNLLFLKTPEFEYVPIEDPAERTKWMDDRGFVAPNRTFPRVYDIRSGDEVLIGGYDELARFFEQAA